MDLDKFYVTRNQLQDPDGVKWWIEDESEVKPGRNRAFVRIRSAKYFPFTALQRKLGWPDRKKMIKGQLGDEKLLAIQEQAVPEEGISHSPDRPGWGGIYENGEEIAFSVPLARAYFRKYPTFLDDVIGQMIEEEIFRSEVLEAEKNSSPSGPSGPLGTANSDES